MDLRRKAAELSAFGLIVVIFVALVAVLWVLHAASSGVTKVAIDSVDRSRSQRSKTRREIVCVGTRGELVQALLANLVSASWTCGQGDDHIDCASRDGNSMRVEFTQSGDKLRIRVLATESFVETAAALVLRSVRLTDPKARVRPVRA